MNCLLKFRSLWLMLGVFVSLLLPLGVAAQQPLAKLQHVRGVLERLDQQQGLVVVSGKSYRLSNPVQVLNKDALPQPASAARPGTKVLLVLVQNAVQYVMLNPGSTDFMEGPSR